MSHPSDPPLKIERALIATIAIGGCTEVLKELTPNRFADLECRALFEELRLMDEAGVPVGDAAAMAHWFSSESAKGRWRKRFGDGTLGLPCSIATICDDWWPGTNAHLGHYMEELNKAALRRNLFAVAHRWIDLLEDEQFERDPVGALQAMTAELDRLTAKVYTVFPEALEATV